MSTDPIPGSTRRSGASSALANRGSQQADLKALQRLIRIGLPQDDYPADPKLAAENLRRKIEALIEKLRGPMQLASAMDQLKYKTLMAEADYSLGKRGDAAENLAEQLKHKRLALNNGRSPFDKETSRADRRQVLWALMATAFYHDYLVGETEKARTGLLRIGALIEEYLVPDDANDRDQPYGTRARLHEFLAQVYRTLRDFPTSEDHFIKSQTCLEARLKRELAIADEKGDSQKRWAECQFGTICTARILGGIGRVAMLQGRLTRSVLILRSAQTLLVPTGQEALKAVLASHLAISERRLCRPGGEECDANGSEKWQAHLRCLKAMLGAFVESKDIDGTRRCQQELARAHLDEVDLLPAKHISRPAAHEAAGRYVEQLQDLATMQPSQRWRALESFRVHVLRATWHALATPPRPDDAEQELAAANRVGESIPFYRRDLPVADNVNAELTACVIASARVVEDTGKLAAVTAKFDELERAALKSHDLVLGGEAVVRSAQLNARFGREQVAQRLLDKWDSFYGPRVNNALLRCLAALAKQSLHNTSLPIDLSRMSLDEHIERLEEQAVERVRMDKCTDKEGAKRLHIALSRFKEIRRRNLRKKQDSQSEET